MHVMEIIIVTIVFNNFIANSYIPDFLYAVNNIHLLAHGTMRHVLYNLHDCILHIM